MALVNSARDAMNFIRNPAELVNKIWANFTSLDGRVTAVESKELDDRLEIVAVNVSATNSNGSSAADETLIGAQVIGWFPVGNMDQLPDNVEVLEDGKVKVTLAAAATEQNQFKVTVLKA